LDGLAFAQARAAAIHERARVIGADPLASQLEMDARAASGELAELARNANAGPVGRHLSRRTAASKNTEAQNEQSSTNPLSKKFLSFVHVSSPLQPPCG